MDKELLKKTVERICRMEELFDGLLAAVRHGEDVRQWDAFRELLAYYEGGQWLQDYELDEKGLLPQNLKRGVLSQDGVYNFLLQIRQKEDRRENL